VVFKKIEGTMKPIDSDRDEFSVVEFYDDGWHRYVERWMGAEAAVMLSRRVVDKAERGRPHVSRVIITDGGDATVFCWERGKGITWPRVA
jgi:hypothetical protein